MKRLAFAVVFALAACSGVENAPEPIIEEDASTSETDALTSITFDGGPLVGTFEATSNEGVVLIQALAEDGTVTTTDEDGNVVSGTYTGSADQFCFSNEGDSEASCFAYGDLGEDGSWTATNEADANEVWAIRRLN